MANVGNALLTYPREVREEEEETLNAEARAREYTPEQWVVPIGFMDSRGGGRTQRF